MQMAVSEVTAFFKSKAFDEWRKGREAEHKMQALLIGRMDGVIKGIGALAKSLAVRP